MIKQAPTTTAHIKIVTSDIPFVIGNDTTDPDAKAKGFEEFVVKECEVPTGTTLLALMKTHAPLDKTIVGALVNNNLMDLHYPIYCESKIEWLDNHSIIGNKIFKHSLSFLLYVAAQEVFPNYQLKILHSLRNGRYCRLLPLADQPKLTAWDYAKLEETMMALAQADLPIKKDIIMKADALRYFQEQGDFVKAATLEKSKDKRVSLATLQNHCQYLFSKLVPSTGFLKAFAITPFNEGFILIETDSPILLHKLESEEGFSFPNRLQASLQAYSVWGSSLGLFYANDINKAIVENDFHNLIILAESAQQRSMIQIADQIYADFPKVKLVLIAGPSSSGKTTFTNRLALEFRSLGLKPIVLSMDNYFLNRADTPLDEFGNKDFEGILAIDLPLFNQHLQEMIAGNRVELPVYDFKRGQRAEKTIPVQLEEKHILLVEGIHGINERLTAEVAAENKRKIYISCLTQLNLDDLTPISSADNRELRRLVRDLKFRGTPTEKTLGNWKHVRAGEEKNIYPFQEEADFYFNTSFIYEWPILRPLVEEHLKMVPPSSPAYVEAQRLLKLVQFFLPIQPKQVPVHSLLQEFLGGSCFEQ